MVQYSANKILHSPIMTSWTLGGVLVVMVEAVQVSSVNGTRSVIKMKRQKVILTGFDHDHRVPISL